MEDILKEVKTLDTQALREKLLENGVKVGPIAPSTISLFQKRLANELFRRQGGVIEEQTTKENKLVKETEHIASDKRGLSNVSGVYYAVCLPEDTEHEPCSADELVFADKDLALKTAKRYAGSRFKVFKSEQDAKVFSRLKAESAFQSPRRPSKEDAQGKETEVSSESSPYKAPKPQDLAKLRKAIESGDAEAFKEQVWNNPRYLVSSGDTPAMYQEGPRYTAMHVAATKNKPEICQAIINILENPEFVNKLYSQSKQTEETQNSRINFLVDLYLNMPDKGTCESPLHMACKYGYEKVVEILAAHPKTDKQLKNKWGYTPKDIICSRCPNPSQSLKKKIEDLLQGQCYVPLMRSEDNTLPPVIGQPWSPDITKSTELPRISHSPRDPSMSVRACAGPMSPTDAGLFHKRWTTPPSVAQSPDQAKAYFNIKRSDSEKGMERIGRQLAHELHVQWSEYWEFLDQFIDLSTTAGLDMIENYLKKRVWLTFVKEFKEKFGITEETADFSGLSTPMTSRFGRRLGEDVDKSFDSVFTSGSVDNKKGSSERDARESENITKDDLDKGEVNESKNTVEKCANNVLSPMSELSNRFASLKMDDSWSERATLDSSEKSSVKEAITDEVDGSLSKDNCNNDDPSSKQDLRISSETDCARKEAIESSDGKLQEQKKIDEKGVYGKENESVEVKAVTDLSVQRVLSVESGSTASYETAAEDVSDGEGTFCSQLSEPENTPVVIRLKDSAIISELSDYVITNNLHSVVNFVVQLKDNKINSGMKVTIVSVPEIEIVHKLLLLENIEVTGCDGDLTTVQEGDVIELGTNSSAQDGNHSVMAYLTRAVTLPKPKYIYGPQPTREDLNVSRALTDVTISPELHPLVFHWKINLSRFLRDTNYRWQSPAKLQSRLRQGSPQPSPLGRTGQVNPNGSPLSVRGHPTNVVTSDIRTKLFPSITE